MKNEPYKTVGQLIHNARVAKGMTQTELARAARTTQASVQRYEAGTRIPSCPLIAVFSALLGVSYESLAKAAISQRRTRNEQELGNEYDQSIPKEDMKGT